MNTLLIVEDEKMIRQGIKTIALRSEVPINNVIECKNGQEALEIIENQNVDVMITDIRMPKMDGITLVKEMQKFNHVPLTVVVSGYDDFSYAVELLRYGVKEYILKPVERTQINNILLKLEQEIQEGKERTHRILNIGYQQLKYLMLNKEITSTETEIILKHFNNLFFEGDYQVCCTNYDKDSFGDIDGITYLKDVDKQGIFIVENKKMRELLNEELCNYYVGVSSSHKGLGELKEAYLEALYARKMAFINEEHQVSYQSLNLNNKFTLEDDTLDRKDNNANNKLDEKIIDQIVQMLGTSKIDEVLKMMDHIHYKLQTDEVCPDSFYENMNMLIDKVISTYKKAIELSEKESITYKGIYTFASAKEFCEGMKEWFVNLNKRLIVEFDDYHNKLKIQQAVLYINSNFNSDLNMAVVSNYISMNYSLFSYAFKQYTGCNFVNYLKNIRIAEAKKLLETTEMRISEIGMNIGYENDKHFMKIFKSICGVSPTEYRKNTLIGKSLSN
ncbi:response regulator transcription factor [Anaeromicropila herbilytica]|uniref:Stage 0 sporulation protein A homolog n=1 Tax=Anaeromicropila herbilytica TaxID=2785025 RepID=A0A7R7EPE7_9FIRM|nr:response regulator [Anaeromicropila herbilytica]BCN32192.1 DNA-binding response regulator [Anaeromicropila herbilytica]